MNKSAFLPAAAAVLQGDREHPQLRGTAEFYPRRNGTLVLVSVRGLPKNDSGFFALHIHGGTDCQGENFAESGMHYNPDNVPHPRHAGDLPPLLSGGGEALLAVWTDRFTVPQILGRTVVIHSDPDDFRSQPAGNSGTKIACGVIRPAGRG